ncbi:hypothetical protein LTR17_017849 [Elasticomyces elasticus]|nr:hypothetical protein LTR17_017849 [Elasticomyces elasticus]
MGNIFVIVHKGKASFGTIKDLRVWSKAVDRTSNDGQPSQLIKHMKCDPVSGESPKVGRDDLKELILNPGLQAFIDERRFPGLWQNAKADKRNGEIKMVWQQVLAMNPKLTIRLGSDWFGGIFEASTPEEVNAALAEMQDAGRTRRRNGDVDVHARHDNNGGQAVSATEPQHNTLFRISHAQAYPQEAISANPGGVSGPGLGSQSAHHTGRSDVSMSHMDQVPEIRQPATPAVAGKGQDQSGIIDLTTEVDAVIEQEVETSTSLETSAGPPDEPMSNMAIPPTSPVTYRSDLDKSASNATMATTSSAARIVDLDEPAGHTTVSPVSPEMDITKRKREELEYQCKRTKLRLERIEAEQDALEYDRKLQLIIEQGT